MIPILASSQHTHCEDCWEKNGNIYLWHSLASSRSTSFFQLPLAYSNNIRFLNLLREREYDKENTQKHGWEKGESQQGAVNGDDHGRCVDIYRTSSETEFKHFWIRFSFTFLRYHKKCIFGRQFFLASLKLFFLASCLGKENSISLFPLNQKAFGPLRLRAIGSAGSRVGPVSVLGRNDNNHDVDDDDDDDGDDLHSEMRFHSFFIS